MLRIEVTAVHPEQANGSSVARQVEMAMEALGFHRSLSVDGKDSLDTPVQSISSIDEASAADGEENGENQEAPAPQPDAAPTAVTDQPARRGRPRKVTPGLVTAADIVKGQETPDPAPVSGSEGKELRVSRPTGRT